MGSSVILPGPGQPAQGADPNFASASQPSSVRFVTDSLPPPSPLYLTRDDALSVVTYNSFPNPSFSISGRFLLPAGTTLGQPGQPGSKTTAGGAVSVPLIVPFFNNFTATSDKLRNRFTLPLFEGFLLGVQLFGGQPGPKRGQCFAYLELFRGLQPNTFGTQTLVSDYLTAGISIGWPGGRIIDQPEGAGWIHTIQQANPAAGADWTFTVPTNTRLRIISMEAQLAVANSGAARPVELIVDDGANIIARMATNVAAPINGTSSINFSAAGTPSASIASDLYAQMPSTLTLAAGQRIRSNTTNIVAGDSWSNIWFLVEEWLEP